ncbi:hypothetical protein LDO48_11530 [Pantoea agglomerans]|nr:hypothetical protein [Pantoea agglomerans]
MLVKKSWELPEIQIRAERRISLSDYYLHHYPHGCLPYYGHAAADISDL